MNSQVINVQLAGGRGRAAHPVADYNEYLQKAQSANISSLCFREGFFWDCNPFGRERLGGRGAVKKDCKRNHPLREK